jgi:hypothetical protein
MRKLRHSKYKNTGFLYEMIVRQITADILSERESTAKDMLSKYFGKGTELGKELQLYQALTAKRSVNENKADRFIDAVVDARKRLSNRKLHLEKFQLVKEIKDSFNIDDFFRSQVTSYKTLASIYKLFENATSEELYRPKDVYHSRNTLIESITGEIPKPEEANPMLEAFLNEDADVRNLSQFIFLKRFNEKYRNLDVKQKKLLREFINNVSNTNSLSDYMKLEVPHIQEVLTAFGKVIKDEVTVIKLNETIKQLSTAMTGRVVKESQVTAVMMAYELIKELKHVTDR